MSGAITKMLPDGRRLHLQHGPIDLIVEAFGPGRDASYALAAQRFETILQELVEELPFLRQNAKETRAYGPTAKRMIRATRPLAQDFITPMAAVAGAVADEVLHSMETVDITKAYVNNGGDIALYLAPGHSFSAAMPGGQITIRSHDPMRGIATSGWRGRSHSLGIADAVTVLARNAAMADAAATMIANAVNVQAPGITRQPAQGLSPDSDLGARLVTTRVPQLSKPLIKIALSKGATCARTYLDRNLIDSAALNLQGQTLCLSHQKDLAYA